MKLRSSDTSDDAETTEDTAVDDSTEDSSLDDSTVDDSTTVQPTFTPAARVAADDVPDDVAAQTPTLIEPADSYPTADEADADPAVADPDERAASYSDEPATSYSDEPAASYPNEPVASYSDEPAASYSDPPAAGYADNEPAAGYADNETDSSYADADADAPVVRYAEVDTFETVTPADDVADVAADEPATAYDTSGVVSPADTSAAPVTAAPVTARAGATPAAVPNLDQPLLSGNTELLSQWQRVQADFVDDPQVAVAGAADLVEQAGQALVDALQQRQRQMRTMWDSSSADGPAAPGESNVDTEQLRQLMQRYRALFNQLYQPV
jgi:hypothetical protein